MQGTAAIDAFGSVHADAAKRGLLVTATLTAVPCGTNSKGRATAACLRTPTSSSNHPTNCTMGCCGEPIEKPVPEEGNRVTPFTTGGPVSQQPSAQSALQWQEKSPGLPLLATPPPVLQYGQPNGEQQTFGQPGQFGQFGAMSFTGSTVTQGFAPTMSPSPPPSSFTAVQTPPLAHPAAIYAPSNGMTISGRRTASPSTQQAFSPPPADEGKLSVAIDFGVCTALLS